MSLRGSYAVSGKPWPSAPRHVSYPSRARLSSADAFSFLPEIPVNPGIVRVIPRYFALLVQGENEGALIRARNIKACDGPAGRPQEPVQRERAVGVGTGDESI